MAPMTDATTGLISLVIQTAPGVVMQIATYLRSRGHEASAADLEEHLSRSDAALALVIKRAREAQGLPPLEG